MREEKRNKSKRIMEGQRRNRESRGRIKPFRGRRDGFLTVDICVRGGRGLD